MNLFLISFLATAPVCFTFDLSIYKNAYQSQVVVPFENSITVAVHSIIEYLAITPVPKINSEGKQLSANLTLQTRTLIGNLAMTSKPSDGLRIQLDKEAETLSAQWTVVEKEIKDMEGPLESIRAKVNETKAKIDAHFSRIQKCIEACDKSGNPKCKGLCQPMVVYPLPGILRRLQANLTKMNEIEAGFEASEKQLNGQLAQMYVAHTSVNIVDTQLKAIIARLTTIVEKPQVLVDMIKNLTDMESVIKPLTTIADQIIDFTPNQADVTYLNTMKQKIATNLPLIQLKLPQYALIPPSSY